MDTMMMYTADQLATACGQHYRETIVLGLNHRSAPIEVRERLALPSRELVDALQSLKQVVPEAVILSTCNRTEVYAAVEDASTARRPLAALLGERRGIRLGGYEPYLYYLSGPGAIRHLFAVASGLDSMVLGEPQILGQVGRARELALEAGSAGPLLSTLFQHAVTTGKRARSETDIGKNPVSVASIAARLARQVIGRLTDSVVLLLGAGKTSELAARTLADDGVAEILVVSRTLSKAQQLADSLGGQAMELADLKAALVQADVVICSTDAPYYVLGYDVIRKVMRERNRRPLVIIDIAVPRDVDPRVGAIPRVVLRNVDDLEAVMATNLREREREATRAWPIVEEEARRFAHWLGARRAIPTIVELRDHAESIRQAELAKALQRLKGLSGTERDEIDSMTRSMVNKLLHAPTVCLKRCVASGEGWGSLIIARQLFGLDSMPRLPIVTVR